MVIYLLQARYDDFHPSDSGTETLAYFLRREAAEEEKKKRKGTSYGFCIPDYIVVEQEVIE